MKIKKSSIAELACVVAIIFTILLSKTVYFGIINRTFYQYVYYAVALVLLLFSKIRKSRLSTGIALITPMIFLMFCNILLHKSDMASSDINQVIGNVLAIMAAILVAICIDKQFFSIWYIRLMAVMCTVSLICWLIAITSPQMAYSFCQPGYNWTVRYGYSPFYTWGWNGTIFSRNSGMFWEPGAFQGFIFIALLMLLFNTDQEHLKHRQLFFVLFLVTILTTQSSTGYILLIMLLGGCWERIQAIIGIKNRSFRIFFASILVTAVVFFVIGSGNISAKLSGKVNDSASIRFSDIGGGLILCIKGGLFGLGETSSRNILRTFVGVAQNDSSGLTAMTYTYGLFFSVYYIVLMSNGIKKFFTVSSNLEYSVILLVFFVLHLTEGLWNLPIYLLLLFASQCEQI